MTPLLAPQRFDAIDEDATDLVVLSRDPVFAAALRERTLQAGRYDDTVTPSSTRAVAQAAVASLGLDVPGLAGDVADLAGRFLSDLRQPQAAFRLEVVDDVSCPKFHIDSVHVRLITTYLGSGTEYCDAKTPDVLYGVPEGAVALLKGRRHSSHAGTILHRSPEITAAAPRVVLVLSY